MSAHHSQVIIFMSLHSGHFAQGCVPTATLINTSGKNPLQPNGTSKDLMYPTVHRCRLCVGMR